MWCWLFLHAIGSTRVALVSFHGGNDPGQINNLYKYDFADNPDVFVPLGPLIENEAELDLRSPRGMLYNQEGDYLLHLNAYRKDSKIVKTGTVSSGSGVGNVLTNANLLHPYGIAMHPEDPHIYVSNQGTGDISRYSLDGQPTLTPVFAHVEDPRALVFDRSSNLWVADKNTTALLRLNANGNITKVIHVINPIGIAMHQDLIFVSSDNGPDGSAVFAYHADTGALAKTFQGPSGAIHHPCGLAVDGESDSLFVMAQSARQIVRFKLSTATYVGPVLTGLEDVPEHIIIIPYSPPVPSSAPTITPTFFVPTISPTTSSAPTPTNTSTAPSSHPTSSLNPSSPSASPSSNPSSPLSPIPAQVEHEGLDDLQIALIVSGSSLLVVLLVLFLLYCRTRRRKSHALLAYEEQYTVN